MFMLLIIGGTLTTVVSFIGIYVGYIFQEVKNPGRFTCSTARSRYLNSLKALANP